ncbi:MAG TPA: hypothetical protein V6D47_04685 [Oscillatoriaceae cyanobacterium]
MATTGDGACVDWGLGTFALGRMPVMLKIPGGAILQPSMASRISNDAPISRNRLAMRTPFPHLLLP